MKTITLSDLKKVSGAEIVNAEALRRRKITGVSTDSRSVGEGHLFFALRGETFDAHTFIAAVVKARAAAIVVRRDWAERNGATVRTSDCVFIMVENPTMAFGELARIYRRKFDLPVVAVGGSNGKTTTKEMIAAVLHSKFPTLKTEGNLNNHIGVPHTLFRLTSKHEAAVVEIGTNHFGEIRSLCDIAEPTHGVITNIGKEHLEFFGDEEGVAAEETELFRYLQKTNGKLFVNYDDRFLRGFAGSSKRSLSYGTQSGADIRAKKIEMNNVGQGHFEADWRRKKIGFSVSLTVPGRHNVSNALAACAVGLSLKIPARKIAAALHTCAPASKRMEVFSRNGVTVLNDTYNSNPDSVMVALKTLGAIAASGKKIVVLGDMRELGETSKREHTVIGVAVAEMKFDALLTVGPFSKYTSEAYGASARHYESKALLAEELKRMLQAGDVVLVKGSRGMKMEEIVESLFLSGTTVTQTERH